MEAVNSARFYVGVKARFEPDGRLIPLSVTWEDGVEYPIDRVMERKRAASMKAGGTGFRYRIRIGSRETYLFLEEDKWFVERR